MADEVIKRCDYPVGKGDRAKPHRQIIEDGESTTFQYEGREYAVDLCPDHRAALADCLEPFIQISRRGIPASRLTKARGRAIMRAKGGTVFTTKDVRNWLREQGEVVADTGRIPNTDIEKYKEAHNIA